MKSKQPGEMKNDYYNLNKDGPQVNITLKIHTKPCADMVIIAIQFKSGI